jgi:hypothetical protein
MKKQMKRLIVHRETLRHLSDFAGVMGGTGAAETSAACKAPTGCDCGSEGGGCTLPATAALGTCACTVTC